MESDEPPIALLCSDGYAGNLDVPRAGHWVLTWPPMLAVTTRSGWHFRIGAARYDYVDRYYQVGTVAIKRLGRKTRIF